LKDDTQVYKQFVENESFKRFVGDMVYALTSELAGNHSLTLLRSDPRFQNLLRQMAPRSRTSAPNGPVAFPQLEDFAIDMSELEQPGHP